MITSSPSATGHFTRIDTLQNQLKLLSLKVDSLNRISEANTIHTTYFHDIINAQVATFVGFLAIIVGLGGYISWRVLVARFEQDRDLLQSTFDTRIAENEENFNQLLSKLQEQTTTLRKSNNTLKSQVLRALTAICYNVKDLSNAMGWGLRVVRAHLENGEVEKAVKYAKTLTSNLMKEIFLKEKFIEKEGLLKKELYFIINVGNEELNVEIKKLEKKVMEVIHNK